MALTHNKIMWLLSSQSAAITPEIHHSITPLLPMLTQLSTIKSRLQILDTDTAYDVLLTSAIAAISARFDKETNRTLARTENARAAIPLCGK